MNQNHFRPVYSAYMKPSRALLVLAVFVALAFAAPTSAGAQAKGSVTGVVHFQGTPPERPELKRRSDPFCAKSKMLSEAVVVNKGKLQDVHVRIKFGTAGKHVAPAEPVVFEQVDCMYRPRVVGVIAGQRLAIRNGDKTLHNIHGTLDKETLFNLAQPPKSPEISRKENTASGDIVTLRCDVHKWMQAFAVVGDHPFFAVSAADGSFAIKNLPAGTYTLEAWHPELGLQKQNIKVVAGKTTKADFRYAAK